MKKAELLRRIEALEADLVIQRRTITFLTERVRQIESSRQVFGPIPPYKAPPSIGTPEHWPNMPRDFTVTCAAGLGVGVCK